MSNQKHTPGCCWLCGNQTQERYCEACWRDPFRQTLIRVYEVVGVRHDVSQKITDLQARIDELEVFLETEQAGTELQRLRIDDLEGFNATWIEANRGLTAKIGTLEGVNDLLTAKVSELEAEIHDVRMTGIDALNKLSRLRGVAKALLEKINHWNLEGARGKSTICEACDMLYTALAEIETKKPGLPPESGTEPTIEEVVDVLSDLFDYIEDDTLVRNIERDGEPDWHTRMTRLVLVLKRAQTLIERKG